MSRPKLERSSSRSRFLVTFLVATFLAAAVGLSGTPQPVSPAAATGGPHIASGFEYIKTLAPAPAACLYDGGFFATHFVRGDCVRADFILSGTSTGTHTVTVELRSPAGALIDSFTGIDLFHSANTNEWSATFPVDDSPTAWPAGRLITRVIADGSNAGEGSFFFNALGATVTPDALGAGDRYEPGEAIPLSGSIFEINDIAAPPSETTGVPASFKIRLLDPEGVELYLSSTLTAAADGTFTHTIPVTTTSSVDATAETDYMVSLGIQVVEATYNDTTPSPELPPRDRGTFAGNPAGTGAVTLQIVPADLVLKAQFASPTGWIKPDQDYPIRVTVTNYTATARTNVVVYLTAPPSSTFTGGVADTGTPAVTPTLITWTIGTLAAAGSTPTVASLVATAHSASLTTDPEVAWKDLSTTAEIAYDGDSGAEPSSLSSTTRGPKVIPDAAEFDTARYGEKPFVIVPVDFRDRGHEAAHTGDELSRVVNSPEFDGSTYNLYQEMSYGQLHPIGTVPSAGIASRGFDYAPGFDFTQRDPTKPSCRGTTFGDLPDPAEEATWGSPAYPERIRDGWYQLPGDTEYYGGDFPAFTLGIGSTIDGACGDTSKSVYDSAQIADPEINYSDYDLDKDGVVDFFMLVFAGLGGNGDSQINGVPPYDNIWPHSSSLEYAYSDPTTGLLGYISDDQLIDLEGDPQCFHGSQFVTFEDCTFAGGAGNDASPVPVRVGPYNVNPESAMEATSVIAHEYGHHLGLPDFYSGYTAYNDWNLMASDYSQHMTVFGKQDMGWVVPQFLQPGDSASVTDWEEIKNDTGEIHWETPTGAPYTLSAANGDQNIHNGEAYGLKLPRRTLIDSSSVPSLPNLWFSGRGNDFGCTPVAGHNLDIALPELADLPSGTNVSLNFKSAWDIEWDFDYGFTMVTTDGSNYTALPSANGYTTPDAINPNSSACLEAYSNGLTGTSQSYQDGTFAVDRNPAAPIYAGMPFIDDEYDLSDYAGQEGVVLRFSYYTDPGLDRPGWYIDDLEVTAGSNVLFSSDFTDNDPLRMFPGGCNEFGMKTADKCTDGWNLIDATDTANLDHSYYLELRDRSGFDANSQGQSDRGALEWSAGVLIEYTDEARGYGNNGGDQPPRQHYLDSQPDPGLDCGEALADEPTTPRDDTAKACADAAFTAAGGDSHFDDDPAGGADPGDWIDNFTDATSDDGLWHFDYNCLSLDVTSLSGADVDESLPSNLSANATIQAATGCADYEYGGQTLNLPPVADAQARPSNADIGEIFIFDGSGSFDDSTPSSALTYEWDFDNDAIYDETGQTIAHTFATAGMKTVTLRVTDDDSPPLSSTDTVVVLVTEGCTVPPFPDVPTGHAFCSEIKWMKDNGIANGYGDGNYKPDLPVTRQAMAAFMARLAGATLTPCSTQPFTDVPVTHTFCEEIKWMADEGIANGFPDGSFKPDLGVTRQAMAAFMARLAGGSLAPCTFPPFTDVPVTHPFCKEIKWMKANGISTGFGDDTYRPNLDVTRQAMSAFMLRLSVYLP